MKRKIIMTDDGSTSIELLDFDEQYHSNFGAIQEARYVYLLKGLEYWLSEAKNASEISILEIGFGTGLNAFLSYLYLSSLKIKVNYVGVEAFPLRKEEVEQLNYVHELNANENEKVFYAFHNLDHNKAINIASNFKFTLNAESIENFRTINQFDLIYFDAFGPNIQPELWTEIIFKQMYEALQSKGVLVTYSAKGDVRRTMQNVGFNVERLPGPPGKRHMLRAIKRIL